MPFPIRKIGLLEMPKIAMLSTPENSITFKKYLFPKGAKTMSFQIRKIGMLEMPKIAMLSTPENWNAQNAENCDAVYKIRMLKMPKIAMLSTKHFLSLRGYQVTDNPENSITF